jgi:predicted deacylase
MHGMTIHQSLSKLPAAPGKYRVQIPVTTDMNGMEVSIWVNVIKGAQPGPSLTLLAGLHGNEWLHLEFFRRFVETCDPEGMHGTVLVIPMANAVAFGRLSRSVPDDSDNADANRSFPGTGRKFTWIAEQLATSLANEVFASTDYLLDFHSGIWGSTMGSSILATDYTDPKTNEQSLDLGLAFGNPLIFAARMVGSFPGPRSAQGYAGEVLGIPCSGSMVGGAGFDTKDEEAWHAMNLRGIRNVMIRLGILPGVMELPEKYLLYEMVHRSNPTSGGLLLPQRNPETFGREVNEGEILGTVVSPFSFDVLDELKAPVDGYLAYWSRIYPVRPGDWAYGVIPKDHPETRWVDRPDW